MKIGDTIKYGFYPQNTEEPEPIEWVVIQNNYGVALLLSKYVLDCKDFGKLAKDYESSEIKKWLENTFYKKAKIKQIPFLLTNEQAKKIDLSTSICEATTYAKKQGVWTFSDDDNSCWWWLRNLGSNYQSAKVINIYGNIDDVAISFESDCIGVRPVIWRYYI